MKNWWNRNSPNVEVALMAATIGLLAVLALLMLLPGFARAATVTLQWPEGTNADIAGYRLYRAETSCVKALNFAVIKTFAKQHHDAPRLSTLTDIVPNGTYCYRMTAFDAAGNESDPSNTAELTIKNDNTQKGLTVLSVTP